MNNLGLQITIWYQKLIGEIMTTVNGKLVDLNWIKLDEDSLKSIEQIEIPEDTVIVHLQQSIVLLESRINQVETENNSLKIICQHLKEMERKASKKLMIVSLIGAVGLTSLGTWIGVSNQASVTANNANHSLEVHEAYK